MKIGKSGTRYVASVPKAIQKGLRLVHNFEPGDPERELGSDGFRAWWEKADRRVSGELRRVLCRCGWAPHLKRHYDTGKSRTRLHDRIRKGKSK